MSFRGLALGGGYYGVGIGGLVFWDGFYKMSLRGLTLGDMC